MEGTQQSHSFVGTMLADVPPTHRATNVERQRLNTQQNISDDVEVDGDILWLLVRTKDTLTKHTNTQQRTAIDIYYRVA